jgi:hypothetical protein
MSERRKPRCHKELRDRREIVCAAGQSASADCCRILRRANRKANLAICKTRHSTTCQADSCNRMRLRELWLCSAGGMASAFTAVVMKNLITIRRAIVLTAVFAGVVYGSIAAAILAPTPPAVGGTLLMVLASAALFGITASALARWLQAWRVQCGSVRCGARSSIGAPYPHSGLVAGGGRRREES